MERRTILKAAALAPTAALLPQTAHAKASLELSRDYATLNAHLYDFYEHKDGVRKFINQLVKASRSPPRARYSSTYLSRRKARRTHTRTSSWLLAR